MHTENSYEGAVLDPKVAGVSVSFSGHQNPIFEKHSKYRPSIREYGAVPLRGVPIATLPLSQGTCAPTVAADKSAV